MDFNLREAIMANIQGSDAKQLQETVIDAIESGEEKMLPGLGVLFEVLWKNSDENEQQAILESMEKALN